MNIRYKTYCKTYNRFSCCEDDAADPRTEMPHLSVVLVRIRTSHPINIQ